MRTRRSELAAALCVLAVMTAPAVSPRVVAAGPLGPDELTAVQARHSAGPPLRVKLWVDRGAEAVYYPGDPVWVTFTVNDDAYVCIYNIDTEGSVQVLFPPPGDPGFVRAHEVVELPRVDCDFEYVVSGPPGIETIEAIASRAGLAPWDEEWGWEWETEDWDERDWENGWRGGDPGDDGDRELEEWEEDWDDGEGWGEGFGGRGTRLDARPIAPPQATGITVSGDPFVAIRRVNRRLLPAPCPARDYDTAVLTFYVGRRVHYPRYTCNDCHGPYHRYDPYGDHCSVFSVRVNVGWVYTPHHVVVRDVHVIEPRYVYVRHPVVPPRYKHLKRAWPSHDRYKLKKEFSGTPTWKNVPQPTVAKGEAETWPEKRTPEKKTGLMWKGKVRIEHPIETGKVIREPAAKAPAAGDRVVKKPKSNASSGDGQNAATKSSRSGAGGSKKSSSAPAKQQKKTAAPSAKSR